MITRHALRKASHSRPGTPGRGLRRNVRGSDIILVMLACLLIFACIVKILIG